jgi:hypothetical protein
MKSDLLLYYQEENPILPFIVAPFFENQDTLIVAPQILSQKHDEFLNQLYATVPNSTPGNIYVRIFNYESYLVVMVMFSSNQREQGSNRKGLVLTLGALIERQIFGSYDLPSSNFFKIYLTTFSQLFESDVFDIGVDSIIAKINNEEHHPEVKRKLITLLGILLNITETLYKRKRHFWERLFSRKWKLSSLPEIIIYDKIATSSFVDIFLSEIDSHLDQTWFDKIDVGSPSIEGQKSITFLKLDFPLPNDVKAAKVMKFNGEKLIKIY